LWQTDKQNKIFILRRPPKFCFACCFWKEHPILTVVVSFGFCNTFRLMYQSKQSDDYSRFWLVRVYIVVAFPLRVATWTPVHKYIQCGFIFSVGLLLTYIFVIYQPYVYRTLISACYLVPDWIPLSTSVIRNRIRKYVVKDAIFAASCWKYLLHSSRAHPVIQLQTMLEFFRMDWNYIPVLLWC